LSGRERNPDQQEQCREHRLSAATHRTLLGWLSYCGNSMTTSQSSDARSRLILLIRYQPSFGFR
jgi:hypothetical protein